MYDKSIRPAGAALLGAALFVIACQEPTSLDRRAAHANFTRTSPAELLECPLPVAHVGMASVGPSGGTVTAGGSSISIPSGALLAPTMIRLAVSQTEVVQVDITAGDAEHFEFESPVSITIDYSRCPESSTAGEVLGAWYVDGATQALLEPMSSTDDKVARTVEFETDHLSSYAVAH
jgi:hypothetical protein